MYFLCTYLYYSVFFCTFAAAMDKNTLTHQKKMDLIAVYDRLRNTQGVNERYITRGTIVELLIQQPAPRFYLEPRTVEHIIKAYEKGKFSYNPKRDEDLYEAYCRVKESCPPQTPMADIWLLTSEQPAKSFYMSPRTIRDFIFGWRK